MSITLNTTLDINPKRNHMKATACIFQGSGVTAYSCHPGNIKSNLGQHNASAWIVYNAFPCVHKTVTQGAATTLYLSLMPGIEGKSGEYFTGGIASGVAPRHAVGCNATLATQLWDASVKLVELTTNEISRMALSDDK